MKQETNKEMDLLLRRLGRTVNSVSAGSGNGAAESSTDPVHLDADELNAYAENALPITARARYTEHLADCTRCRQMVSQLSQAAGLVFNEPKEPSATESGFKALLASLLSPLVLRYALPALGLLVVASIGFFVLRDSSSRQIAGNLQQRPVTPAMSESTSANENVNVAQPKPSDGFIEPKEAESRAEKADQNKAGEDSTRTAKQESRPEPTVMTDQVATAPTNAPAGVGAAPATVESKPVVADDQKQKSGDVAQRQQQRASEPQTVELAKANEEAPRKTPPKEAATAGRTFSGVSAAVGRGQTESAKKVAGEKSEEQKGARERDRADKDSPEKTSVAGRRFRKDGSVWIDVAYSSQATTIIKRGSEQYRALVADEPGIRTIAEQLSGEVIVVWKGRAYRIR